MTSVHSINTFKELERFFESMYGDQIGYVYIPTKNPMNDEFRQHFFEWPTDKSNAAKHAIFSSKTLDVYYSPVLYSTRDAGKESFKGSNYVWVDFDGNAPANIPDTVPEPSIKIQSSISGHEHWYWRLEGFVTGIGVIEDISQRLAHHLKADLGCWSANHGLRPPFTRHQGSSKDVVVLKQGHSPTSIMSFVKIPPLPVEMLQDDDIKYVPPAVKVIFDYKWEKENRDFFLGNIPEGNRSGALTRLCFVCIEMGMENGEVLSIIKHADDRWKKYADRKDQRKWLVKIINYCRMQKAIQKKEEVAEQKEEDQDSPFKVYNFIQFMRSEVKLEWAIPGLVNKKGIAMLSGPPGTGKSQLSIRLCEKLARGEDFLIWKPTEPMRTLYIQMEMNFEETKEFTETMQIREDKAVEDNFLIMPVGYSEKLNNLAVQSEINNVLEEYKPTGVVIDSYGVAIGDDISATQVTLDAFRYIRRVINIHFGAFVWLIHHHRKAQPGNRKPNKLDDLFGNAYIGNQVRTSICVWPTADKTEIEVSCLKMSLSKEFEQFNIKRTPDLDFKVVEQPKIKSAFSSNSNGKPTKLGDIL